MTAKDYKPFLYDEVARVRAENEMRAAAGYVPGVKNLPNSIRRQMREAAGMKDHAWTCTACGSPCTLTLVTDISKFMSRCCTAPVRPTKEEL